MSKTNKKHKKGMSQEKKQAKEEEKYAPKVGMIRKLKNKIKALPAPFVIIMLLIIGAFAGWLRLNMMD